MEQLLRDTTFTLTETVIRLELATFCALLIGLDREIRGISAGIRTHALVSLSSAVITVSVLELYGDTRAHGRDADPLCVVQGLAQAIGFIAAGAFFVSQGAVRNLTTAANIWLATAVGIAAGAGQFVLVAMTTAFGVIIVTVVGFIEHRATKQPPSDDKE
jgi:putative Mg2+ transporter-C (MgtC) family protein